MGCVDSKPPPNGLSESESVEITAVNASLTSPSKKTSSDHTAVLSPKQRLALSKAGAGEDVHNPAHKPAPDDENEYVSDDDKDTEPALAPPPSPKTSPQVQKPESISPKSPPPPPKAEVVTASSPSSPPPSSHSTPTKKLKMSEILQAERVNKTIVSNNFSGEVRALHLSLFISSMNPSLL
jgi:hypothetical protein